MSWLSLSYLVQSTDCHNAAFRCLEVPPCLSDLTSPHLVIWVRKKNEAWMGSSVTPSCSTNHRKRGSAIWRMHVLTATVTGGLYCRRTTDCLVVKGMQIGHGNSCTNVTANVSRRHVEGHHYRRGELFLSHYWTQLSFYTRFPLLLRVTFCKRKKIKQRVCTDCFYSCKIHRPIHESG